ncbi:hypothetical protein M8C21_033471 [Ambrosia artemisiifolia]|uniref:Phospholipid-transporting ATPase n=1 Tax=Ambrosia artemisiifolia TaxID=4212 RepID=A0AAD5CS56_AMBAR|nr:hypothetical protein M8C21_033471 [Ambrosia artemisiifolia]
MQLDSSLVRDNSRLIYINNPQRTNEEYEFTGNEITTSKYTVVNFLPKNLFIQFHRVAYIYFLVIAALNQLPPLAVFGRTVSLFPLLFVLTVTAIKDGYEDWRRHRSDRNENNKESLVLQIGEFQPKRWKDIQVGEVVKICADEAIPCDMVLLGTSDPSGVAYIQTMNLDGESNLKTRYARQETSFMSFDGDLICGIIRCEQPNRNIYEFTANMELNSHKVSLSQSNIILRGCQVKNTEWVVGVVVYAGQETKAMLNSAISPSKRSKLEQAMNKETIWLSVFLFVLCLVVAIGMCLWLIRHQKQIDTLPYYRKSYLVKGKFPGKPYKYYGIPMETFFAFLSSIIVFQIMIPISLYITMELVRLGQSYFMIEDKHMYDSSTNSRFQCRSLNINEDLGQIRYVFSDKTGTLTENKMEFRKASVFGKNYCNSSMVDDNTQDTEITEATKSAPVSTKGKNSKPDITVDPGLMGLLHKGIDGDEKIYAHEFFLTLAACNTVIPIHNQPTSVGTEIHQDLDYQGESPDEQALVAAACAYGYILFERTSGHIALDVNGEKLRLDVLGLHEFDSVRKRMSVVIRFPDNNVKVLVKGADTSILTILRKDQENDDITLITQRHLTEYSSLGLRTLVLAAKDLTNEELEKWQLMYEDATTSLSDRSLKLRETALFVESNLRLLGATGIEDKLQEGVPETIECLRQAGIKLFDLATSCRVVLCCRVAPLQKAGIVDLIKSRTDDMTLAIGDGANDVSMIQMADVGVGICGQEGRQAVMASDFAMGQYILCAAFSTTSALTDWSSVFYSVIYTSVPTIIVGILDKDLSHKTLLQYPKLYEAGHRHESYNTYLFWLMMADTIWQSLVLFCVPRFVFEESTIDIWGMGSLWTVAVVILVNIHLAMDIQRWVIYTHVSIWGSVAMTFACVMVLDSIPIFPNYGLVFFIFVTYSVRSCS